MLQWNKKTNHTYLWHGITHLGVKKYGIIYAKSQQDVKIQLSEMKIIVRSIHTQYTKSIISLTQKIWFCRQLAILMNAHISLHAALELLQSSHKSLKLKFLIATLINDLDYGLTLTEAIYKHHQIFNKFFCSLIKISEASGTLTKALEIIVLHYENTQRIYQHFKKTLTYPLIVIALGCIITISLCIIIVPQFEELFQSTKISLPLLTKIVIWISHSLRNYGMYILSSITIIITALYNIYKKHNLINLLPVICNLYNKTMITKFTQTLSLACSAGISLIEALELVLDLTTNYKYREAINQVINDIRNGHEINHALDKTALFPQMMTQMLKIGMRTGKLTQVLQHIAQYYTQDTEQTIASIMQLLEPIITILLGLFVGSLVIAIYVPLLQLGTIIST